jgi:hypothetical protein
MYALILTLCSFASCNGYIIATDDAWHTQEPCNETLYVESDLFGKAFTFDNTGTLKALNNKLARSYLNRFNVQEEISTLTDYDFTCEKISDSDVP